MFEMLKGSCGFEVSEGLDRESDAFSDEKSVFLSFLVWVRYKCEYNGSLNIVVLCWEVMVWLCIISDSCVMSGVELDLLIFVIFFRSSV